MLVRIKFTSDESNRLTDEELKVLEDFLGENINTQRLKLDEHGKPISTNWRDTFDPEYANKHEDYTLVTPSNYVQISETNNYIVDIETFTSKFPSLEFTIKGMPKSASTDYNHMLDMMNKVSQKIEDAKNHFDKTVEFNQRCDVHVPGLGLLNINRLAYATDYCTEELQRLLHQGWRIISVCPQPDQRRPDYILGMTVSNIGDSVEVEYFSGDGREGRLKERDYEKSLV